MSYFFSRATVGVYTAFIVAVSVAPLKAPPAVDFPFFDKIIHGLVYFLLAFVLVNTLSRENRNDSRRFTFIYCFSLGLALECVQHFLPYRSFELPDQAVNSLGAIAGLFFVTGGGNNAVNLFDMLERSALRYPRKTAIIFGAKKITYADLLSNSRKLASSLRELGARPSDKIALWLYNCPEFVYSFFAVLHLGATVVPINTMLKREEAHFIVADSGAKIIIANADKTADIENMFARRESLETAVLVSLDRVRPAIFDFYTLIAKSDEFSVETAMKGDYPAQIIYTSGTTGRPKGACLTHGNLLANVRACRRAISVRHSDCFICLLPLFHSFSSTVCMLLPVYLGAKIVIIRSPRPFHRVVRSVFKNRVSIFVGIPSIYKILAAAKFPKLGLFLSLFINPIRICVSGAASLPLEVCRKFEARFRRPLLQGYGLTEASPVVSMNPLHGKRKSESVGLPLLSVRVRVVNADGKDAAAGQPGELLVQGPNVMKGYYNLADATAEALDDGWLRTGDVGKVDADGFIYIIGRIKEMINVGGLNVYPKEIEDLLGKDSRIKEAAVVGVPHHLKGEAPVAFIIKEGELAEREVVKYLRENLASYKVPLRVFFKESLPKNTLGKVLKFELQREVENLFR